MREIVFVFEEIVLCFKCASRIKKNEKKKTNIHVEHLRFNIIFYHDIDDLLNETKAIIINKNTNSTLDVLLIINISLIIDDSKYKFKNKLIFTIY